MAGGAAPGGGAGGGVRVPSMASYLGAAFSASPSGGESSPISSNVDLEADRGSAIICAAESRLPGKVAKRPPVGVGDTTCWDKGGKSSLNVVLGDDKGGGFRDMKD